MDRGGDLLRAGRAALQRGAWEEARLAFEGALTASQTPEALEGLGWALFWLDRTAESLEVRECAYRLFREAGDGVSAARVAYGLAVDSADLLGEAPASGWLERARRLLDGVEPGPEHGWLALWEGHFALLYRRDTSAARASGGRALELGRRLGLFDLEMLAVALEGLVHVAEGAVREGMLKLDEATAAALAGEMSALTAVGATCCLLVHACERIRDYDRAAQWAERVQRFSRRWGITPALAVCRTQHAAMLIGRGQWAEAEQELTEAAEALAASRPLLVVESLEQLAELRRRQGRFEEAQELFARVEGRSLALYGRAAMAFERGDSAAAADLLERFLRRTPPDNWNGRATALGLLARARLALGDGAGARAAVADLGRLAERIGSRTIVATAREGEGLLAAAEGRSDEARRRLEDAVDLFTQAQAPYEAARVRLELADCLARLGRPGPALQEARSALECFQRLGASRDAVRAEALSRGIDRRPAAKDGGRAPAPPRAPGAPEGSLTGREIEVLRLVAGGLSDKEIAQRLCLSPHTVHRHISNVRTKLGLPSRAAAVAWAAQSGVL